MALFYYPQLEVFGIGGSRIFLSLRSSRHADMATKGPPSTCTCLSCIFAQNYCTSKLDALVYQAFKICSPHPGSLRSSRNRAQESRCIEREGKSRRLRTGCVCSCWSWTYLGDEFHSHSTSMRISLKLVHHRIVVISMHIAVAQNQHLQMVSQTFFGELCPPLFEGWRGSQVAAPSRAMWLKDQAMPDRGLLHVRPGTWESLSSSDSLTASYVRQRCL
jgi:hypothetical protein